MNFEERFRSHVGRHMAVNMGFGVGGYRHLGTLFAVEGDWAEMRWEPSTAEGTERFGGVVFRLADISSFQVVPERR